MSIKGIIWYLKKPKLIFNGIGARGHFLWMSDERYLKIRYKAHTGKKLNIDNPKTFNEKIQWLKVNDRKPIYSSLVDKYAVRNFIKENIGEQYLIPLIGVYNSFDDIDFDNLPEQFVMKCNHDSGSVVVCRNKSTFDIDKAREKLMKPFKLNYYWNNREWAYKNINNRCIVVEKYIEQNGQDNSVEGLIDYKFYCFNGEAKFLYISKGLENHSTAKISFFDLNGEKMPFKRKDYEGFDQTPSMPTNLNEMINISNKLASLIDALFVRIDFYEVNDHVYFSEFTFYPAGGMMPIEPEEWDEKLGDYLKLPIEL